MHIHTYKRWGWGLPAAHTHMQVTGKLIAHFVSVVVVLATLPCAVAPLLPWQLTARPNIFLSTNPQPFALCPLAPALLHLFPFSAERGRHELAKADTERLTSWSCPSSYPLPPSILWQCKWRNANGKYKERTFSEAPIFTQPWKKRK